MSYYNRYARYDRYEDRKTLNLDRSLRAYSYDSTIPIPHYITRLIITNNNLKTLPPLPMGLLELYCAENALTSLPPLPPTLVKLICFNNALVELPPLPETLVVLECSYNKLRALPELPETLQKLHCNYNTLTVLPELPISLRNLECNYNRLTALPELPQGLQVLESTHNLLTTLPPLPNTLTMTRVNENPYPEPLRTIITRTQGDPTALRNAIKAYNRIRRKALHLQRLRKFNASAPYEPVNRSTSLVNVTHKNAGVDTIIGSFLTGKEGTVKNQIAKLRENASKIGEEIGRSYAEVQSVRKELVDVLNELNTMIEWRTGTVEERQALRDLEAVLRQRYDAAKLVYRKALEESAAEAFEHRESNEAEARENAMLAYRAAFPTLVAAPAAAAAAPIKRSYASALQAPKAGGSNSRRRKHRVKKVRTRKH